MYAADGLKCPHPAVATLARAWEIGRTAHALSSVATVIWKGLHQTVETARSFSGKNTFAKTAANNRLATTPTPDNRGSGKLGNQPAGPTILNRQCPMHVTLTSIVFTFQSWKLIVATGELAHDGISLVAAFART